MNEGIFSRIIDFLGKAIENLQAYFVGLIARSAGTITKKEAYEYIDHVYKYSTQGMNSQGIEAMKEIVKQLKKDVDNGLLPKVIDLCLKVAEYTEINSCK